MTLIEITAEEAAEIREAEQRKRERKEALKNVGRGKRYASVGDMLRDLFPDSPAHQHWEEYSETVLGDPLVLQNARLWEKWSRKAILTKSKPLKKKLERKANKYGARHRIRLGLLNRKFEEKHNESIPVDAAHGD
jgi:hypothetical protein